MLLKFLWIVLKLKLIARYNKKCIFKNVLIKETSTPRKEVDPKYIKKNTTANNQGGGTGQQTE